MSVAQVSVHSGDWPSFSQTDLCGVFSRHKGIFILLCYTVFAGVNSRVVGGLLDQSRSLARTGHFTARKCSPAAKNGVVNFSVSLSPFDCS
jgi:hypothetical protein